MAVPTVFDDAAVADLFDEQVDAGRSPQQFGRLIVRSMEPRYLNQLPAQFSSPAN